MEDERTEKRMNDFAGRADRFEGDVKERFDRVDREFDKVDARFDKVEADSKELGGKIDKMTRRLTGGLITVVGAVIIKGFLG
jgi:peptidoglycan hydrolase CwlO-like protein